MNSQDNRWAELEQQEAIAKQIIALIHGSPLEAKCDVSRTIDGWRVAFGGLSESEARHIVAAVAIAVRPSTGGVASIDAGTF